MEDTVGRLVLASASPRRKEILEHAGFGLAVVPSGVEEHIRGESPAEVVENLASDKAGQVAARLGQEGACVVGADTVVVLDGRILGKPKDEQEACQMLAALAGRSHQVLTGVCIVWEGVPRVFSDRGVGIAHEPGGDPGLCVHGGADGQGRGLWDPGSLCKICGED